MYRFQANNQILFVSTHNYCRSRFAELFCNSLIKDSSKDIYSYSRGLKVNEWSLGRISPFVLSRCRELAIELTESEMRLPRLLSESDFVFPKLIISIGESGNNQIMKCRFPKYFNNIEFWDVPNPTAVNQSICFQIIEYRVLRLVKRIFENSKNEVSSSEVLTTSIHT